MPPEARQMIAPAGSICMYHAATWHRSHVNVSARPRIGLLQAFVPDTIAEVSTLLLFLL
jgi:ectoine hydroxylase-related dioxygenase (phytanoyl-CoA dioxygenase family)